MKSQLFVIGGSLIVGSCASSSSLPPASSKAPVHTPRPGLGTAGMKCKIRAIISLSLQQRLISQYEVHHEGAGTTTAGLKAAVDGALVSDGILPLHKPEVLPLVVDTTKACKHVIQFEILLPLRRLPNVGEV